MAKLRRIFNYRPMCVAALALIVGIIVAEALYGEHIALIAIPLSIGAVTFALLLAFKRTRKFFYIPLAMLVGFSVMTASNAVYDSKIKFAGGRTLCNMTATVSGMIFQDDVGLHFYIHDIYVDGEKLNFDGKVEFYSNDEPDFNAGDVIHLYGYISGYQHEKFDNQFAGAISGKEGYIMFVYYVNKRSDGDLKFPKNLQHKIKKDLYARLDDSTASICTALLLGDKFGMDDDLKSNISTSGLSHVLAVSGLHISTLASALYFLLKKLKIKPSISLIAVSAITFMYVVLCSFAASALRAFVMSFVFNFASGFGKKRDNLSAISLAAILILTFRPTALLEMGFLLSFSSMLGIFLFHKSFNDVGQKIVAKLSPKRHIGAKVVDLACVSLSATLMSYPFIAYFIGAVPLFQMLSNILLVPYVMVCYVILLVLTVFSLITTLTPVLVVMKILLFPFVHYVNWVGGLSVAVLPLASISIPGIALYEALAVFLSRFNIMPKADKLRAGLISVAAAGAICAAVMLI